MPGLRLDDSASAAPRDDISELLEHPCGAVKSTAKIVAGDACEGETPAAWMNSAVVAFLSPPSQDCIIYWSQIRGNVEEIP